MTTTKTLVTKDSIIGTILKEHPKGNEVIQKYFGGGCLTCRESMLSRFHSAP